MELSHTPRSSVGFHYCEKPNLSHLLIGLSVSAVFFFLFLQFLSPFLMNSVSQLLSTGQIIVIRTPSLEAPQLAITLADGSDFALVFTWQRSGLASIIILSLLFLFLMFPFRGSIWRKLAWLELGFIIGLTWSFIRLSTAALVAYHFGPGAFQVAEFLMGPFTDFLWIVSLWSVGLSTLASAKRKR